MHMSAIHVGNKSHLRFLTEVNLFLSQPGGVLDRLLDIFFSKSG